MPRKIRASHKAVCTICGDHALDPKLYNLESLPGHFRCRHLHLVQELSGSQLWDIIHQFINIIPNDQQPESNVSSSSYYIGQFNKTFVRNNELIMRHRMKSKVDGRFEKNYRTTNIYNLPFTQKLADFARNAHKKSDRSKTTTFKDISGDKTASGL